MKKKEQLKEAKINYKKLVRTKGKKWVNLQTTLLFSDAKSPKWGSFIFYGKRIEGCHIQ